jgi:transposase-like protein
LGWYLRYKPSFRDLVEMMSERGLHLAHTTILRWVRQTVDFRLSRTRDARGRLAARCTKLRSSKYLNNLIEQDHRGIKRQFALECLQVKGQVAPVIWNAVLAA